MKQMKRNLNTIFDVSEEDILNILAMAKKLKKRPLSKKSFLKGKSVGLIFEKPSTRTRLSFEVGVYHLGGQCIYVNPNEVHLGVRESVEDFVQTLSRYLDLIVARTFTQKTIVDLSSHSRVPLINGLSDVSHPCQALTDLFTIKEKLGRLKGVDVAYVGDGNNVINSLLIAGVKVGVNISIATPKGFEVNEDILKAAYEFAKVSGSKIRTAHSAEDMVRNADVVYTDTWVSMGQEEEKSEKIKNFVNFQVNEQLCLQAKKQYLFMHCLPAHRNQEVESQIIDGEHSIVFDQAENRLHTQKAIMLFLLKGY